jgi:hypothetical protein
VIASSPRVVLLEAFSKVVSVHPNYCVLLRVELAIAGEHIKRDAVFRDLTSRPRKLFFGQVFEQAGKLRRAPERCR